MLSCALLALLSDGVVGAATFVVTKSIYACVRALSAYTRNELNTAAVSTLHSRRACCSSKSRFRSLHDGNQPQRQLDLVLHDAGHAVPPQGCSAAHHAPALIKPTRPLHTPEPRLHAPTHRLRTKNVPER